MIKNRIFIIMVVLGLMVVGCSGNEEDATSDSKEVVTIEETDLAAEATEDATEISSEEVESESIHLAEIVDEVKLIPLGWELVRDATGDLNGDSIDDLVQIIEKKGDNLTNDVRKLQIAFGVANNQYQIDIETDNAILLKEDGGVWGEPLDSLAIDDGKVIIDFFGGSNYRWYATYRFAYDNGNWFLVSLIQGDFYSVDLTQQHHFEYDLITGVYQFESANYKGDMIPSKGNINNETPMLLEEFDIYQVMENTSSRFEDYELEVDIDLESLDLKSFMEEEGSGIQSIITVRNVTFYRPLTLEEATKLKLDYDGVMVVNDIRYITFDWVDGEDGMDEEYEDSLMTAETYGETFGLRVASIDELTALIEEESFGFLEEDESINYGWPMIYWTGDKGGDDDGSYNPMQFDMTRYYDGGLEGWDFPPFNYPVILVSGELYDPDYSGTRDIKEKVINEDGTGYLDVRLFDYASEEDDWVIIQFNQETKIHLINGELGDVEDITTSQEGMDIVMDNNGTYAKDIYLTPFNMW